MKEQKNESTRSEEGVCVRVCARGRVWTRVLPGDMPPDDEQQRDDAEVFKVCETRHTQPKTQ